MKKLEEKEALQIYDVLRELHSTIKEILFDEYKDMDNRQQNAIEAVHSVLYLAEGVFANNE